MNDAEAAGAILMRLKDAEVVRWLRERANDAINAEKAGHTITADDYDRMYDLRRAAAQLEGSPWPSQDRKLLP